MLLSVVLELPEFKKRGITRIGTFKTADGEFCVLARHGEKLMPLPKMFHLVDDGPDKPDPDLDTAEIESILRRFAYFEGPSAKDPISQLPKQSSE